MKNKRALKETKSTNISFYAPGSTVEVTDEEIQKRIKRIEHSKQIGMNITSIDERTSSLLEHTDDSSRIHDLILILQDKYPDTQA